MKKLKRTPTNKALVLFGCILGLGAIGAAVARKEDRKHFAITGMVLGLVISPGIMSIALEPKLK